MGDTSGKIQDSNGSRKTATPYPYSTEAERGNPTVIPSNVLQQFYFAFLIRHPKHSIPSYVRCTVPLLDKVTGWYDFLPEEAGYNEQRRLFNYLRDIGQIGPKIFGQSSDGAKATSTVGKNMVDILVFDVDDLLDHPATVVERFCKSVGTEYTESLLKWDKEEDQEIARPAFQKWTGWHEDALNSTSLRPRPTYVTAEVKLLWKHELAVISETGREEQRRTLQRVDTEIWRGWCKDHQANC